MCSNPRSAPIILASVLSLDFSRRMGPFLIRALRVKLMSLSVLPHRFFTLALLLLTSANSAMADFEISVGSGLIDPDGNLMLQIGINSTTPPQLLSDYELILEITPLGLAPGSSLVFANPQSESFLADADYVFAATSESISEGLSTVTANTRSQITLIDVSANAAGDFLNVDVTTGQLLASVDLKHFLGGLSPAAVAGHQYEVSVSLLSGFFQASGDEVDFTGNSGIVTVGAVAIPEPSFLALLGFASCGCVLARRRRNR